jgi:hypothetical protein
MQNFEAWNMALNTERQIATSQRRLERKRHLEDAMAPARRPALAWGDLPRRAWHATIGLLSGGSGSRLRRGAREAQATTAEDVFLTYQPHEC